MHLSGIFVSVSLDEHTHQLLTACIASIQQCSLLAVRYITRTVYVS